MLLSWRKYDWMTFVTSTGLCWKPDEGFWLLVWYLHTGSRHSPADWGRAIASLEKVLGHSTLDFYMMQVVFFNTVFGCLDAFRISNHMSKNSVVLLAKLALLDTCYCWVRCCRCLGTAGWGRSVEGSRSRLWRISSGKGLRLMSGGRSAEDYQLLREDNRRRSDLIRVSDRLYMMGWFQILTYGRCFWKVVHPTLEVQTPSPPQSCCCGPAPALSRWTAVWPAERGAPPPAFHLLSEQTESDSGVAAEGTVTTFKDVWNSRLCFCTGLVFGMLVRG